MTASSRRLSAADGALYDAKESGRDGYWVASAPEGAAPVIEADPADSAATENDHTDAAVTEPAEPTDGTDPTARASTSRSATRSTVS